jgi:hypothetical protein
MLDGASCADEQVLPRRSNNKALITDIDCEGNRPLAASHNFIVAGGMAKVSNSSKAARTKSPLKCRVPRNVKILLKHFKTSNRFPSHEHPSR